VACVARTYALGVVQGTFGRSLLGWLWVRSVGLVSIWSGRLLWVWGAGGVDVGVG